MDGYYARLPGHRLAAFLPLFYAKRGKGEKWREIQAGEQKERKREIEIALCDAARDRSLVANLRRLSEP